MTDDKVIEKVRKLLALAERAGSPEEAENATARATEMMIKYAIDEAVLQSKAADSDDAIVNEIVTVTGYAKAKLNLMFQVADALGLKMVIIANNRSGWSTAHGMVTGWKSDMDLFKLLFASLQMQAERGAEQAVNVYKSEGGTGHGRTFKQSFVIGFSNEVGRRLRAQYKEMVSTAEVSTPGTGLVLVDRKAAVERAYAEKHGENLRSASGPTARTYSGYTSGRAAGAKADIGQSRIGGSRTALR